jgi:hypothetical protein
MNILNRIAGKAVGECIHRGHDIWCASYSFRYTSVDYRVYNLTYKCKRCGYTVTQYSNEEQSKAIKVLNDGYKKS